MMTAVVTIEDVMVNASYDLVVRCCIPASWIFPKAIRG